MRASAKSRALTRIVKTWGAQYAESDNCQTFAIDLIADLLHFCQENGVDFDAVCTTAEMHYGEERREVGQL